MKYDIYEPLYMMPLCAMSGNDDGGGGGGEAEGEAQAQESEAPARPEFVPEKFWDGEKNEVRLEQAFKSYGDLERAFRAKEDDIRTKVQTELEEAQYAKRPETSDAYQVALPKDYEEMGIHIADDDPLVGFWREEAHSLGLSQEQFNGALKRYVDHALKNNPDPSEELQKLGDTGRVRVQQLGQWAERNFRDDELAAIQSMTTTAAGVTALERLMQMSNADGGPPRDFGSSRPVSQISDSDLQSMMDDPKYWDPMRRDPAHVERVRRGFERLYGSKQA